MRGLARARRGADELQRRGTSTLRQRATSRSSRCASRTICRTCSRPRAECVACVWAAPFSSVPGSGRRHLLLRRGGCASIVTCRLRLTPNQTVLPKQKPVGRRLMQPESFRRFLDGQITSVAAHDAHEVADDDDPAVAQLRGEVLPAVRGVYCKQWCVSSHGNGNSRAWAA